MRTVAAVPGLHRAADRSLVGSNGLTDDKCVLFSCLLKVVCVHVKRCSCAPL